MNIRALDNNKSTDEPPSKIRNFITWKGNPPELQLGFATESSEFRSISDKAKGPGNKRYEKLNSEWQNKISYMHT